MKQKWKWQKAKIKNSEESELVFPGLEGKEIWLIVEKPKIRFGTLPGGERDYLDGYVCNLLGEKHHKGVVIDRLNVEWLARSPKDFAMDVPYVSFEEWSQW